MPVNKYFLPLLLLLLSTGSNANKSIEEVVVTADFRPHNLWQLPVSASVIGADAIEERGAQHLESILNQVPNLNFASGAFAGEIYPDSWHRRTRTIRQPLS